MCGCVVSAACGGTDAVDSIPTAISPSDTYWSLEFQDHAINLSVAAPTNTVKLVVVARNAAGDPLPGVTATPTFTVADTVRLHVSADGVLTALGEADQLPVVAEWQYGTVTHIDTTFVKVTAAAPASPLATLSLQLAPGDSAKWSMASFFDFFFGPKVIVPTAIDQAGQAIPVATTAGGVPIDGIAVSYWSSNRGIAAIDPRDGTLNPNRPGTVLLRASTYAYGVRKTDTLTYTIGLPLLTIALLQDSLGTSITTSAPHTLTIGVGGLVDWANQTTHPVSMYFTPAAGAPFFGGDGGDVIDLPPNGEALREFDAPGTYQYKDANGRVLGAVIVQPE